MAPDWGFGVAANVDPELESAVVEALLQLTRDHPAAIAGTVRATLLLSLARFRLTWRAQYAAWQPANSYAVVLRQLTGVGLMSQPDGSSGGQTCIRSSDTYDALVCPSGSYKRSRAETEGGCVLQGRACRPGATCLCGPCRAAAVVQVLAARCENLWS